MGNICESAQPLNRYAEELQVNVQSTERSLGILKQVGLVSEDFTAAQLWEGNGVVGLAAEDAGDSLG